MMDIKAKREVPDVMESREGVKAHNQMIPAEKLR